MDEEGEQFVTYFLPTKETLDKRMTDTENGKQFDPDYTYVYFVAVVLSRWYWRCTDAHSGYFLLCYCCAFGQVDYITQVELPLPTILPLLQATPSIRVVYFG